MGNIIKVGMADYKLAGTPNILATIGLGSCVGVVIFDPIKKVAGMAHIMLPISRNKDKNVNIGKYADTAIPQLINELEVMGAVKSRLVSKLAGGAQMFSFNQKNEVLKIGKRNILACREILAQNNISILSEDVGGNKGRTIEFNVETGILLIKTLGSGVKEI